MVSTTEQGGGSAPTAYVETRKRVRRVQKMKIDLARLEKYFGMPLYEAAEKLGVSTTTVKKKCRELGVKSWPRATRSKNDKDDTNSVDTQQQRATRSSRQSPSPEHESESEGTNSNTSVPMGGNSGTSSGVSVGSQSPSGGGSCNGASDNSGGGSDNQSGGGSDNSGTTLDPRTWSQDSSSSSKESGTWKATQLSFGLSRPHSLVGYPTTDSQFSRSDHGYSSEMQSLYPVPLAPRGFINPQVHQTQLVSPHVPHHPATHVPAHNALSGHSPAHFQSNHSPAHFSAAHVGGSRSSSHPFSVILPSAPPPPNAQDQAAANVSQEAQNLQLLQQQTQLQMMRLQRAELELRIQSLQQSLGPAAPSAPTMHTGAFHWPP